MVIARGVDSEAEVKLDKFWFVYYLAILSSNGNILTGFSP